MGVTSRFGLAIETGGAPLTPRRQGRRTKKSVDGFELLRADALDRDRLAEHRDLEDEQVAPRLTLTARDDDALDALELAVRDAVRPALDDAGDDAEPRVRAERVVDVQQFLPEPSLVRHGDDPD